MHEYKLKISMAAEKLGINLYDEMVDSLIYFMELVLKRNESLNLTSIRNKDDFIVKHIIDSLTIERYIKRDSSIIDIGTGAGFPGIPVKIARPDIVLTLLDSKGKKIDFLNEAIIELELDNTEAVKGRAEDIGQGEYRGCFDAAAARAVSSLSVLSEYALPLLKRGGIFIAMKGPEKENAIKTHRAVEMLGGIIEEENNLKLPGSDIERNIIIIRKIKDTPSKYPRRPGIPTGKPL